MVSISVQAQNVHFLFKADISVFHVSTPGNCIPPHLQFDSKRDSNAAFYALGIHNHHHTDLRILHHFSYGFLRRMVAWASRGLSWTLPATAEAGSGWVKPRFPFTGGAFCGLWRCCARDMGMQVAVAGGKDQPGLEGRWPIGVYEGAEAGLAPTLYIRRSWRWLAFHLNCNFWMDGIYG